MKAALKSVRFVSAVLLCLFFIASHALSDTLYVQDGGDDKITKIDSSGNESLFADSNSGLDVTEGMAFDNRGNLYAVNAFIGTIVRLDLGGDGSIFANTGSSGGFLQDMAFDCSGNLYVSVYGSNSILRVDSLGNVTMFANSNLDKPKGLAFDNNGYLYAANWGNNTVAKFDPNGNGTNFISSGLNRPAGLAFDNTGNLYVANAASGNFSAGRAMRFDPSGVGTVFGDTNGGHYYGGLAFDSSGYLYVTDYVRQRIEKYNPSGTNVSIFAATGGYPGYIAIKAGDGIPSLWRRCYFGGNGTITNRQSCGACDADGTGQNNLFKYVTGLDPTNPASVFALSICTVTNQPTLGFGPLASGRTYTAQFSTDPSSGVWSQLTSYAGPQTNGNQVSITDINATQSNKFYRIQISMP